MTIDAAEFRRVLGHFATGVTVLTTRDERGAPAGLTLSAFASLSLHPPLVLACVDRTSDTHDLIADAGFFAINILAADQERLARRFADEEKERKFDGIAWRTESTGAPVLSNVLGWIDCRLHASFDAGDHTIFAGEVAAADARDATPLVFYRGGYALTPEGRADDG